MKRENWLVAIAIGFGILAFAGGAGFGLSVVDRLADAIAFAEGWYVAGSRSQRNNNPGDLTYSFGFPTTGNDGPFPIFATAAAGLAALNKQVSEMFDGSSQNFNPSMSIAQVGQVYAGGDPNWANNVASRLGVTPDTLLSQL
jgi:hypothetical protein